MNITDSSRDKKGFTLLEVLIAVFILVVVLSTVYASYSGTFRIIRAAEDDGEIYAMARTAMERMFKDLNAVAAERGAVKFTSRLEKAGREDSTGLTFVSGAHLAFSEEDTPSGLAEITYSIDEDPKDESNYRLLRRDVILVGANREEKQGGEYVLCERLQSLIFKFYDIAGNEYESWDSASDNGMQKNKAPAMTAIELKFANKKDKDRPYTFSTNVFLPASTVLSSMP